MKKIYWLETHSFGWVISQEKYQQMIYFHELFISTISLLANIIFNY